MINSYHSATNTFNKRLSLEIMALVWTPTAMVWGGGKTRPLTATAKEQQTWEKELRQIVFEVLRSDDKYMWCYAISLAGSLEIEEARPEIARLEKLPPEPESATTQRKSSGGFMQIDSTPRTDHSDYHKLIPQTIDQIDFDEPEPF
jgi:hypothetical protein